MADQVLLLALPLAADVVLGTLSHGSGQELQELLVALGFGVGLAERLATSGACHHGSA